MASSFNALLLTIYYTTGPGKGRSLRSLSHGAPKVSRRIIQLVLMCIDYIVRLGMVWIQYLLRPCQIPLIGLVQ